MINYSSQGELSPHFDESEYFLDALAGKDQPYTFQTFDDVKLWNDEKQKFVNRSNKALAKIFHGTFEQHKQALTRLNKQGAGVYITVNQTDLKGRTEAHITGVRALFLDLDGSPLQPINDLPEDLQPHIVIESSSDRWHAYWLVNNCELVQFKQLQQALAAKFDGDKAVNDLPRVMRLAGFIHNKDASKPFITRIVTMQDSLMRFSVNRLIDGLGLHQKNQSSDSANANPANSANPNYANDGFSSETLAELREALRFLSSNNYEDWLRWAMSLKSIPTNAGFALYVEFSQRSDKFDYNECLEKWRTLEPSRTGYKAIFAEAQRLGWQNPKAGSGFFENQKNESSDSANPANPEQWSEPLPLLADNQALPYPIDAMPDVLSNAIKEVISYTKCPTVLAGNSALAFTSLAAQGLVNVARDSILNSPVSLYLMGIGGSGERKSSADKFFSMPFEAWEQSKEIDYKLELKNYKTDKAIFDEKRKGLLSAINKKTEKGTDTSELEHYLKEHEQNEPLAPRLPQFIYQEATPEGLNKGLAKGWPSAGIMSDEASIVFGGHGNNADSIKRNLATLNMYWEDKAVKTNRSDSDNNLSIRGRRLTMGLAAQADMVRDFFEQSKGTARSIGFGARFLIAWPESTQGTRFYTPPLAQMPNLLAYRAKIGTLLNYPLNIDPDTGALELETLTLSAEATAVWIAYHDKVEGELGYLGEFKDIKDVASKSADNAARLAALFHVLEHGITGTISDENMQRGVILAGWHLYEARRFFGQLSVSPTTHNAIKLDAWLITHCQKTQTNKVKKSLLLTHAPYAVRSKDALDKALGELVAHYRTRLVTHEKTQYIEVNPALLEAAPCH